MIVDVTRDNISQIKNSAFAACAGVYLDLYDDYMAQVSAIGIPIDTQDYADELAHKHAQLKEKAAVFRNSEKSIYINTISPACLACRDSVGSETFFISLQCHRDCYYCFNPNQEDYDVFLENKRELIQELDQIYASQQTLTHLAVTGGEPLLHKAEVIDFLDHASKTYPDIHKRLYTCGDHADQATLEGLQRAGLEEIRFSIRMHDLENGRNHTLNRIQAAVDYIPSVMVEMPIIPGTLDEMRSLLVDLDRIGVSDINLLEFCYPFVDPEPFIERGFKIKKRPYKILYNYWYASGLPISRSEIECLDLLDFAIDNELRMGVHYCSLENKFTAQLFKQNYQQRVPSRFKFSEEDFFFKSAKVFGNDIPVVLDEFAKCGYGDYAHDPKLDSLEFHVDMASVIEHLGVEIGISTQIVESRNNERFLRELKIDQLIPDTP